MWLANSGRGSRVQTMGLHDVVADGDGQGDFAPGLASKHAKERRFFSFQLERKVLDVLLSKSSTAPTAWMPERVVILPMRSSFTLPAAAR